MEQAQEIIERVDERPPDGGAFACWSRLVGECDLGDLNRLVAVLRPDCVVDALRRFREAVLPKRTIDIVNSGAEARRHPGAELPRRCMRIGSRWSIAGCLNRSCAKHIACGVPQLVHEVAGVLQLLWRETLIGARCGPRDECEAQCVGADLVNH